MKIESADSLYKKGHLLINYALENTPEVNKLDSDENPYEEPPPKVKECYQKAVKAFEKCLELDPNFVNAWKEKAVCCNFLKMYEEGLFSIEKAIALKPDDFMLWNIKWICLYRLGRMEESNQAWKVMNDLGKKEKE